MYIYIIVSGGSLWHIHLIDCTELDLREFKHSSNRAGFSPGLFITQ